MKTTSNKTKNEDELKNIKTTSKKNDNDLKNDEDKLKKKFLNEDDVKKNMKRGLPLSLVEICFIFKYERNMCLQVNTQSCNKLIIAVKNLII